MRRIVQISAVPETEWNKLLLYALCDDGTLWAQSVGMEDESWYIKDPIPQGPDPELTFVEQRDRIADMIDRRES